MNKILAIVIILAAIGAGVYFLFFFNKEDIQPAVNTPEPSYDPDSVHDTPPIEKPLNVVVSTDLVKEVLYQFARSRTNEPYVCIKPGANPMTYTPTKEDEEKILGADLVIYMGLGIEPGLEELIKKASNQVRCEPLSSFLEEKYQDMLITSGEYESGYDPHFWWNPRVWEKAIRGAVDILSDIDPAYEFNYGSIFIRYGQSLSLLDRRYIESWSRRLSEERRVLVTLNPAFTYFADKYNYKTLSLYTPDSPGKISEKRFREVAEYVVKNKVPALFPEVGFPTNEMEALQALVKDMGYEVKLADPLYSYHLGGEGSKDFIYLNAGRTQMDRIYEGLKTPEDPEMPAH